MKILSVRQPWAWLLVSGHKPVENRTWATSYRGPLLIHASKSHFDDDIWEEFDPRLWDIRGPFTKPTLAYGAIVGVVELIDCVNRSEAMRQCPSRKRFHVQGPFCWMVANAKEFEPIECKGQLGLWTPTADILTALRANGLV